MRIGIWFLAALLTVRVSAQTATTGEVAGTVMDASGAVVISASVLLRSLDTGESR